MIRPTYRSILLTALLCTLAIAIVPAATSAQPFDHPGDSRSGALFDQLARMDSALFEAAFVACDAPAFARFFTDDAEFHHDLVGPKRGEEARRLNGCPREQGVRRVLEPGSLEVFPMAGYGAVQTGRHRFVEDGAETSTTARFVHLWKWDDGEWRLSRVISYDHRSAPR
jgi:ketosteroid isomerase-like protein